MILDTPDKDLLVSDEELSEDEIIAILADKVQAYLECNINLLMSYLYRLDVLEYKIKSALSNSGKQPGNVILAKLIWERQKERLKTKRQHQSLEGIDEEWKW